MKVIGCLGRKGGSGKTMASHFLAHGLSKGYGVYTNVLMTDVRQGRPIDINPKREYYLSSISNKDAKSDLMEMHKVFELTNQVNRSVLVIDGGANRVNIDDSLAEFCDVILIPMGTGSEDIDVAEADFWRLAEAVAKAGSKTDIYILRNRWPGTERKREALLQKPWVSSFMTRAERARMLFPDFLPDMPSLLDMSNYNDPKTTPLVDSLAVGFAEIVSLKLGFMLPPRRKLLPYDYGNVTEAA
jgi:hypothetical protein